MAGTRQGVIIYDQSGRQAFVNTSGRLLVDTAGVTLDLSGVSLASNVSGNTIFIGTSGSATIARVNSSGALLVDATVTANANISGQTVFLASGQNAVQMSGQTVQIAGGVSVSGNMVSISGQPVTVSGNAVRISGSMVSVSGQPVNVSGNAIRISGETVSIAGGINVSGSPVRVSGEVVYPVSGNAYMFGFDESGQVWNQVFMDTSGGHRIKVAISGDTVQIAGGVSVSGNMVSISGQPVSISGQVVRTSGQVANISGNTVVVVSGWNGPSPDTFVPNLDALGAGNFAGVVAYPYGYAEAQGVFNRLRVTSSGQGLSGVTSKLIVGLSGDPVSISGQAVRISGQNVYTLLFDALGFGVLGGTSIAENSELAISGAFLYNAALGYNRVNDQWVRTRVLKPYSGVAFSGMTSGYALLTAGLITDTSGNIAQVTTSGRLAVDAGAINVASNISGNVVYLVSGQNSVQISGQTVVTSVSGIALNISGNTVYLVSGQNPVQLYAFDPSGVALRPLIVNQSGGNVLRVDAGAINVASNVSGNVVYLTSGQNNVQISGQLVVVSGIVGTSVSGNMVSISGQPVSVSGNMVSVSGQVVTVSGNVVNVSGNVVNTSGNAFVEFGTVLRVNSSGTICTSLSGGTELHSGVVFAVNLRNLSGNAPIYVGGTGSNSPFSGFGMLLFSNESQEYRVDNFNRIRVFATTSGQRVRAIAVGQN